MKITLNNKTYKANFVEKNTVTTGVECLVYSIEGNSDFDIGIVSVKPGYKTPLQRIMGGDKTIERYVAGSGTLTLDKGCKGEKVFTFNKGDETSDIEVEIGQTMQWHSKGEEIKFIEFCFPLYKDGRFKNMQQKND